MPRDRPSTCEALAGTGSRAAACSIRPTVPIGSAPTWAPSCSASALMGFNLVHFGISFSRLYNSDGSHVDEPFFGPCSMSWEQFQPSDHQQRHHTWFWACGDNPIARQCANAQRGDVQRLLARHRPAGGGAPGSYRRYFHSQWHVCIAAGKHRPRHGADYQSPSLRQPVVGFYARPLFSTVAPTRAYCSRLARPIRTIRPCPCATTSFLGLCRISIAPLSRPA